MVRETVRTIQDHALDSDLQPWHLDFIEESLVPRTAVDHVLMRGSSVPLAFSRLTPKEVCAAFQRGLSRPVRYKRGPITFSVSTPTGYREHLQVLEWTLGKKRAPYFGPDLEENCTSTALDLWGGYRSMEEYAREVFPVEEEANGLMWMKEEDQQNGDVRGDEYFGSC